MNVVGNVKWMSFEQIQEAVKVKSGEMRKLDNRFLVRILIALPFITVPTFLSVEWAVRQGLSPVMLMLLNVPHLAIITSFLMVMLVKDHKKLQVMRKDVDMLKAELVLNRLGGGEFVDAPVFSDDWFDVKVRKNGDVKQYMVRLLHDEDGLPFVESRVVG